MLCCFQENIFFPVSLNCNQNLGKKSFSSSRNEKDSLLKSLIKATLNYFLYSSHSEDPTFYASMYGESHLPYACKKKKTTNALEKREIAICNQYCDQAGRCIGPSFLLRFSLSLFSAYFF